MNPEQHNVDGVLEVSGQKNLPGIYKHPETGAEIEARNHPKFGSAQADGYVRVGYVWSRPLPTAQERVAARQEMDDDDKKKKK